MGARRVFLVAPLSPASTILNCILSYSAALQTPRAAGEAAPNNKINIDFKLLPKTQGLDQLRSRRRPSPKDTVLGTSSTGGQS